MARILVVDDEKSYTRIFKEILMAEDHDVRTAESGPRALEIARTFSPQVLIADLMLKGNLDGLGVSDELRSRDPDMKTILITGVGSRDLQEAVEESRIAMIFEKPFDMSEILSGLSSVLESPA